MTQRPLQAKNTRFARVARHSISGQRGLVLMLALLATLAVTLVRADASWSPWTIWIPTALAISVSIVLMLWGPQRTSDKSANSLWIAVAFGLIAYVFPLNIFVKGVLAQTGEPFELVMLAMVQHAAVVAVAMFAVRKAEWISGLLSFFLFVFCVTMSSDRMVYLLAGIYGLLSIWWLMGAYWERIQGGFVAQQSVPVVKLRFGILIALVAMLLLLGYVGSTRTTTLGSLLGFMPTSGGSGENDDSARSGIGDGDRVVAAQDSAMSFGPVESELFLEDTSPSLYDMFSDVYGDDPKKITRTEKAVSLGGAEGPQKHQHLSQSQKSSREFSAVRRAKSENQKKPEQKLTSAMLYLIGEVPTHLVMESFDAFDGRQWTHQQPSQAENLTLAPIGGKPYVRFIQPSSIDYALKEQTYGVKLINLKSPRIPSPHLMSAVHIDKVDRVDFYGMTADGVPQMVDREHIPQLTVLHLKTLTPHIHALRRSSYFQRFGSRVREQGSVVKPEEVRAAQAKFESVQPVEAIPVQQVPLPSLVVNGSSAEVDSPASNDNADTAAERILKSMESFEPHYQIAASQMELSELAGEWTQGVSRGWSEVDAIVDRLREEFVHDPAAIAPEDCEDVVAHFLQTKRGPDYLFATTAAMLLRSRGFPTRLVTGFYADPKDFEYATAQTIIRKEDLHTWLQVTVDGQNWISLEPCPDYLEPIEDLNWLEWSSLGLWSTYQWLWRHPLQVLATSVLAAWCYWARLWLFELGLTLWVAAIGSIGSLRNKVLWILWLMQWRGRLYGKPRPSHKTLRSWLRESAQDSEPVKEFIPHVERMLYGPAHVQLGDNTQELNKLCKFLLWGRKPFSVSTSPSSRSLTT
jgi:protein-glutamine gamma-glutamyltransferase